MMSEKAAARFMSKVDTNGPEAIQGLGPCWIWMAGVGRQGYGVFSPKSVSRSAHRVSYEHFNGAIEPGMFICHRCDVRRCVNPEHLYQGTVLDNARDAKERNRRDYSGITKMTPEKIEESKRLYATGLSIANVAKLIGVSPVSVGRALRSAGVKMTRRLKEQRGESNSRAVLTEEDVLIIRAEYANGAKQMQLAARFGVGQMTISHIVRRATWAHVTDKQNPQERTA